jgi:hypothetical protein
MPPVYVPILKGKEGEFAALEVLSSAVRDAILPLIEMPHVAYDYVTERPAKTLDEHVAGIAARVQQCWPDRPLYIHLPWFGEAEQLENGNVALHKVLGDCREANVRAIPVITTSSSAAYLAAVRDHLVVCDEGLCVRLTASDFDEEGDVEPAARVDRLVGAVGLASLRQTDLILDLANIGDDIGRATLVARAVIGETPRPQEWRRVIVAAASFPENLSDVDHSTTAALPRLEWELWGRLQRRGGLRKDALFGDYAIAHPVPTELDPRTMRMSASIRYTTLENWLIVKGRNVRQFGFDQYYNLCRILVELPEYSGEGFSWGDGFIARCARGSAGPGNATTWRKVGTNHHLTLVARELATVNAA